MFGRTEINGVSCHVSFKFRVYLKSFYVIRHKNMFKKIVKGISNWDDGGWYNAVNHL